MFAEKDNTSKKSDKEFPFFTLPFPLLLPFAAQIKNEWVLIRWHPRGRSDLPSVTMKATELLDCRLAVLARFTVIHEEPNDRACWRARLGVRRLRAL
jgi:hypothetical protein